MTTNLQQGTLLDVLKKKMRQTKEEMEKYKDECEEFHKKLQMEVMRREEVSFFYFFSLSYLLFDVSFIWHTMPMRLMITSSLSPPTVIENFTEYFPCQ